ncbi:MAG: MATE family efflux transporter [Parashewanella sp.]
MKDKHGLLNAPIGRVLFNMSLPNLFGYMSILGFNLVDTFFISRLGTQSLAAISFTFPISLIVISIGIGLGVGVSTNLGRLIGSGDSEQAKIFLHDSLVITFLIATALCLLGSASIDGLFSLLGATGTTLSLIHDYLFVWYLGAPILLMLMVGNQAFRATGDTRTPAQIMMLSGFINVILDPLLIFGIGPFPRLEMQGAAIATLISWVLAFTLACYFLVIKRKLIEFAEHDLARLKHNWIRLSHIAKPAAFVNLLNPIVNALIMAILARFGHDAVAAYGAGTRLESILLMVVMALSASLMPFISQNLGAGNTERAHQALKLSLIFILIFQSMLYVPVYFSAPWIASIFSTDTQVLNLLTFYIIALPCAYGPLGVVILFATSLNAYHKPMSSVVINVCRLFLLMLPLVILGGHLAGVKGVFLALPISNILMGFACFMLSFHLKEKS